jgi:hypothetical protein
MNLLDLSQLTITGKVDRQFEIRNISPLRSGLEDALVFFNRVVQLLAFLDIHRARLLAIDILARAGGPDGGRGMPAVPRSYDHRVNIIALQNPRHVVVDNAILVPVFLVRLALDYFAPLFLNIGDGDELTVLVIKESIQDLSPPWAQSNASHYNPIAGSHGAILAESAGRYQRRHADDGNGSGFQEITAGSFGIHILYIPLGCF